MLWGVIFVEDSGRFGLLFPCLIVEEMELYKLLLYYLSAKRVQSYTPISHPHGCVSEAYMTSSKLIKRYCIPDKHAPTPDLGRSMVRTICPSRIRDRRLLLSLLLGAIDSGDADGIKHVT